MKQEVFIVNKHILYENQADIDKAKLDEFEESIKAILAKDDYNFSEKIKEIAFFVVFDKKHNNDKIKILTELEYVKGDRDDIGITHIILRLDTLVRKNMIDSKLFGVNANLYLALNHTQQAKDQINYKGKELEPNEIMQSKISKSKSKTRNSSL